MQKILHIRSSFDPGGTESLLLSLFNSQPSYFKIFLVLIKPGTLIPYLNKSAGNEYFTWYRQRFLDFTLLRKISKLIKWERINVVHTHQLIELIYAILLKIIHPNIKIIYNIHCLYDKKDWAFHLEKFLSQNFTTILTVSHAAKNQLVKNFNFKPDRITVVYNGIKFEQEDFLTKEEILQKLPVTLDKERINMVMVANFVWGKDHETIFRAYKNYIKHQLPQVNIYFIGKETAISERLKKVYLTKQNTDFQRVVFCGAVPNAKSLLPAFDIILMSCFSETFNKALVEAAALGKTILASDIPTFRELSNEGRYFHLFTTGDDQALFNQLKTLIKNNKYKEKSPYADYFLEKFSLENLIQNLRIIYQKTVASNEISKERKSAAV